ncbi:hypothetical protein D770_20455 [Flammeovirgaceae bacterium 311]|nr:hypothetical protein D770_20455 [Flammeovirgaceae bacterium 311]
MGGVKFYHPPKMVRKGLSIDNFKKLLKGYKCPNNCDGVTDFWLRPDGKYSFLPCCVEAYLEIDQICGNQMFFEEHGHYPIDQKPIMRKS